MDRVIGSADKRYFVEELLMESLPPSALGFLAAVGIHVEVHRKYSAMYFSYR